MAQIGSEWGQLMTGSSSGAALDPETVTRYFRQAVKKPMLPQIRLHDLRHTHAIPAIQEEVAALIAGLVFTAEQRPA